MDWTMEFTNSHATHVNYRASDRQSELKHRYQEHIRRVKQNDTQSAYALHIPNNNHEYGIINITMTLYSNSLKPRY